MARVPDAEIERLKAEVSLVSLAEAAGVELRQTGPISPGAARSMRTARRRW